MANHLNLCALLVNRLFALSAVCFLVLCLTTGRAFPDGGHGGAPVSQGNSFLPVLCAPHTAVHATLTAAGEQPVASGPTSTNGILGVLYVHPQKGTWTWVGRYGPKKSCVMAAGENWRPTPTSQIGEQS